jgi:translocator protein
MRDSRIDPVSRDFATTRLGDGLALIGLILLLIGAGTIGRALFAPDEWYAALQKPSFHPPGWVFGPVWATLYATMAVALWLVRRARDVAPALRSRATTLFALQFALNLLWTPLFFRLRSPALAVVDICLLWIALLMTLRAFGRVRPLAGWVLLPYLLWVSFALVLNGTIWRMNA